MAASTTDNWQAPRFDAADELAGSPASAEAKAEITKQLDAWEADYRQALDAFFRQRGELPGKVPDKATDWAPPKFP